MRCLDNTTENLAEAVRVLKAGGVIAHPADTCFGLAADLSNEKALQKLQAIKGREASKPMSIMLPSFFKPNLGDYGICNNSESLICDKLFPGPITIVLPKGSKVPSFFFPEIDSIGIRMPYDELTDELLMQFKGPLITTSANLSSELPCSNSDEVTKIFENRNVGPDLILDGAIKGECRPSTVIKLEHGKMVLLREGPLSLKQLEGIVGL